MKMTQARPNQRTHPAADESVPKVFGLFIDEPQLLFGQGNLHPDPKHGMWLFGPCTLPDQQEPSPAVIRVGFVGDRDSVDWAKSWIQKCGTGFPGKDERPTLFPRFPGFQDVFRCRIETSNAWEEVLTPGQIEAVTSAKAFQQRVGAGVDLFSQALSNYLDKTPRPDVVLCALPDSLLGPCGIEGERGRTIRLSSDEKALRKEIKENIESGQEVLVPFEEDYLAVLLDSEGTGEFYKRLKITAMELRIPIQISMTRTFRGGPGMQDDATRAWNFCTALYYKGGGYPWRPAHFETGTCYVGITFYRDKQKMMRTSIAQVFTHTGETLILRGNRVAWDGERNATPHMTEAESEALLSKALSLYYRQMRAAPRRLVIHKSSKYWDEELAGLSRAAKDIENLDMVAFGNRGIRLFRLGTKPPIRGTMMRLQSGNYVVYTKGYVPFLRCYPGPRVPRPLEVLEHHGPSSAETICREILMLSKMNWNTSDYSCALPITLDFSDRVGEVLVELAEDIEPRPEFKWYM